MEHSTWEVFARLVIILAERAKSTAQTVLPANSASMLLDQFAFNVTIHAEAVRLLQQTAPGAMVDNTSLETPAWIVYLHV